MIDLDAEWTNADDLYCYFGLALCLGIIPYSDWRRFCYRFSHYRYVLPDDRHINPTLMDAIYGTTKKTASEMMRFVLLIGQIEVHFTEPEQARILSLLVSGKPRMMEKSPKSVVQSQNAAAIQAMDLLEIDDPV